MSEPWEWGSDFCDAPGLFGVNGVWEDVGIFAREQDYLDAFAEYVGDKPWKGGWAGYSRQTRPGYGMLM